MMINKCFQLIVVFCFFASCSGGNSGTVGEKQEEITPIQLTVKTQEEHQTIHSFGASDAWSIQFVGANWPTEKKEKIANLLFSREDNSEGDPLGIGLSVWRFNIGAGSARQGEESGISDLWRRSESFLTADSTFDWTKQEGQQWFMQAAKERGVEQFIGFANSPPVLLTKNQKAYGNGGGYANISSSNYEAFADYLAKIGQYFSSKGMALDYLSPVNEPQWDWAQSNGQEGSPYQNSEISDLVKVLDKKIQEYQLNTKIEIPEAAKIDFLMGGDLAGRSNQASYLMGDQSEIKNLPSVAQKLAAHSYFTTWPVNTMIEQRQKLWQYIQSVDPGLEYWMSEYCILANNDEVQGGGRDLGIDPALYIARLIHYDLTQANASSWQWWLAVSPYDYKDGLIYIDKNQQNGQVKDSKMLWALGNYSRFIRPGALRLSVDRSDSLSPYEAAYQMMVSAYIQKDSKQLDVVVVNYSRDAKDIKLEFNGSVNISELTPYITSSEFDLHSQPAIKVGQKVTVPARSITTFTGNYTN